MMPTELVKERHFGVGARPNLIKKNKRYFILPEVPWSTGLYPCFKDVPNGKFTILFKMQ